MNHLWKKPVPNDAASNERASRTALERRQLDVPT
jgi:hypothetical protein